MAVVELLRSFPTKPYLPRIASTTTLVAPSGLPEANVMSTPSICPVTVRDPVVTANPTNQTEQDASIDIPLVTISSLKVNAPEDVNGCLKTAEPAVDGVTCPPANSVSV